MGSQFSLKDSGWRCLGFFKWRSLNLTCLTSFKKFTFKLSRSASYLYWVVGQKNFFSLPYPSLIDLTNHSIDSFFSNMGVASDYSNCIGICLIPIWIWILFKMAWKMCVFGVFHLKNGLSWNEILLLLKTDLLMLG